MLTQSDHRDLRPMINPPVFPSTPSEFITVVAHYHRAEIARMAGWRDRIDRTTNWAITVVAAMLSLSLSTPTAHHGVLLFAMVLVLLLLVIEARRYRFLTFTAIGFADWSATTSPRSSHLSPARPMIGSGS